jgi:hypothetical protein
MVWLQVRKVDPDCTDQSRERHGGRYWTMVSW